MPKWVHRMSVTSAGPSCANCGMVRECFKSGRLICPHARRQHRGKHKHRGTPYGLTKAQVASLPVLCEICKERPAKHIDHCHLTGRFRGHLCQNCNHGIGNFKDNTDWLENAIAYLNER